MSGAVVQVHLPRNSDPLAAGCVRLLRFCNESGREACECNDARFSSLWKRYMTNKASVRCSPTRQYLCGWAASSVAGMAVGRRSTWVILSTKCVWTGWWDVVTVWCPTGHECWQTMMWHGLLTDHTTGIGWTDWQSLLVAATSLEAVTSVCVMPCCA
jgi:hypothetical protein